MAENIHTEFHRFLKREDKEQLLAQKGAVIWLYGLSGSGKSTVANAAERILHEEGRFTVILDGDNLRSGLNSNLGFSDEDRSENVRRASQVAKLFASQGIITLVSVITPRRDLRALAREVIGEDFAEVYIKADFETCAQRDPKGLYAKVKAGKIKQFTGKDSGFEEPETPELVIDTTELSIEEAASALVTFIQARTTTSLSPA
jgi:adenylylsulfate kinase